MQALVQRYWRVGIQGFLSGLPFAAVTSTLQAEFIAANASTLLIGSLSFIGQVYLYKFILAALSDSFKPPFLKKNRDQNQGWILISQLVLIISLISMALVSAHSTPYLLISIAFTTAIFSAFQDVNIDSYRIKLLRPSELNQGSAYYLLGFRIGMLLAGGISIVVGDYFGWHVAYGMLALLMSIGIILTRREQLIRQRTYKKQNFFKVFFEACRDLKQRPHVVKLLLFVLIYGLGDAFTVSVNNTFLIRAVHFSFTELAFYANTLNVAMLLLSTVVTRYCFKYFSLTRCLVWFSLSQIMMLLLYALVAATSPNKIVIITAILMEGLSGGVIATALVFVISTITRRPFTTTQYAVLSAFAAFKNVILGPLAALVVQHSNWTTLYLLGAILALPGTYLGWRLKDYLQTTRAAAQPIALELKSAPIKLVA